MWELMVFVRRCEIVCCIFISFSWDRVVPESYLLKNTDDNRMLMRKLLLVSQKMLGIFHVSHFLSLKSYLVRLSHFRYVVPHFCLIYIDNFILMNIGKCIVNMLFI